jgi:hypothetical protein
MAKYLAIANYNPEGVRGLLKDGGSKRREVVAKAIESLEMLMHTSLPTFLTIFLPLQHPWRLILPVLLVQNWSC